MADCPGRGKYQRDTDTIKMIWNYMYWNPQLAALQQAMIRVGISRNILGTALTDLAGVIGCSLVDYIGTPCTRSLD